MKFILTYSIEQSAEMFPFFSLLSQKYTKCDNKVRELATWCVPWQQWTET
jgi:hypothetical protein